MAKWPFKLNKQPSKEAYLHYKRGHIVEEAKVRRKELHEGKENVTETIIREENTPDGTIQRPVIVHREEEEQTRDKLNRHIAFGGNVWMRALVSLLSFLLVLVGISFMGRYALEIIAQPVPEAAVSVDVDSTQWDWKGKLSGLFSGWKTSSQDQPDSAENPVAETPTKKYNEQAERQLAFANDLHKGILDGYRVLAYDAGRYGERKINLVTLTSNLNGLKLKMAPYQLQIEETLGDGHPLYENLRRRLDGILENIAVIENTKRSQVVLVTNEKINWENSQNQAYITELTELLNAYGIPYTNENGIIRY